MKFTELNLDSAIQHGIRDAGFTDCTKVQERTFQYSLEGIDVTVQSQTGTGKTAAFLISIFELFLKEEYFDDRFALIVVPTRELAVQIEQEALLLGKHLDFKVACVFGGVGYEEQEHALRQGPDILIATPGRLLDFDRSGKLSLHQVGALVIDEADRLFDMGFMPDIRKILRKVPPTKERWTLLSSATLDGRVRNLAWREMSNPAEIAIEPERVTVDTVIQSLYHVTKERKLSLLLGVLGQEKPASVLIFTNTKHAAEQVARRLCMNGYEAEFIIGDLPQKKRLSLIDKLKAGALPVLVATDVAARGLHIDGLDLVVNYDLPEHAENYVHRIGRTARAGKSGKAISLACEEFVYSLEAIEEYTRKQIPVATATPELFLSDRSAGVRVAREQRQRPGDARNRRRPERPAPRRPSDRRSAASGDRRSQPPSGLPPKRPDPVSAAASVRRQAQGKGQSDASSAAASVRRQAQGKGQSDASSAAASVRRQAQGKGQSDARNSEVNAEMPAMVGKQPGPKPSRGEDPPSKVGRQSLFVRLWSQIRGQSSDS